MRYIKSAAEIDGSDIVILPGTKNTIEDLNWLKQRGIADRITRFGRDGGMVIGICGGYQMLGETLRDPLHTESRIPEIAGLGLLNFDVEFLEEKTTVQAVGRVRSPSSWLSQCGDLLLDGYEIHSGVNTFGAACIPFLYLNGREEPDGVMNRTGNVLGTYLHGIFDTGVFWRAVTDHIRAEKGLGTNDGEILTMSEFKNREFNRLADIVRTNLDMEAVYRTIRGEEVLSTRWKNDD